ncbi:MAG: phosphonoacetaldehyde hydrolase [Stappiaceae bacterium]
MVQFKGVVFDWAGTMVDFGSRAPMGAFVEAFESFGVTISAEQARGPMGLPKRDHIATLLVDPTIASNWAAATGSPADEAAIDRIYEIFVPLNEDVVTHYADLVPGAIETVRYLRARNIKIGSTTGYVRSIMERVIPLAAKQGYEPDNLVCSDDLPEGRPGPLGMYQCFIDLVAYPPSAVIKVDDTAPGIAEGVAAGCVTVGVALSGNVVGLSHEELADLPLEKIEILRQEATRMLKNAGADHVIDSVADLPDLISQLEKNL